MFAIHIPHVYTFVPQESALNDWCHTAAQNEGGGGGGGRVWILVVLLVKHKIANLIVWPFIYYI